MDKVASDGPAVPPLQGAWRKPQASRKAGAPGRPLRIEPPRRVPACFANVAIEAVYYDSKC
jgi:hypothetical protein